MILLNDPAKMLGRFFVIWVKGHGYNVPEESWVRYIIIKKDSFYHVFQVK